MRARMAEGERPLDWVGSSLKDFRAFPKPVQIAMGMALSVAQFGGKHPDAKPMKGFGRGVLEVVERHDGNAYRAVFLVRFKDRLYVLHAFQKKSPKGIATANPDLAVIRQRLRQAVEDYRHLQPTERPSP